MNGAWQALHQPVASTSKLPSDASIENISKSPFAPQNARPPGAASTATHRLLWRGSLLSDTGAKLHGIAFVAHFPPGTQSPASSLTRPLALPQPLISSSASKRAEAEQNPFLSTHQQEQEADSNLCLDLEVLRHADLTIQRTIELQQSASLTGASNKRKRGSLKSRIESLKKGNDRMELADPSPDGLYINVYVDPRCSASRRWLERRFCDHPVDAAGKTNKGLLLTLGGPEESSLSTTIIIYGSLQQGDQSPPKLQLKLARKKPPPKAPVARPDDPLPRENLFTQKLRRTTSEPALSFDTQATAGSFLKAVPHQPTSSSSSNFVRTKSMVNVPPHASIASARNPFASSRTSTEAKPTAGYGDAADDNLKKRKDPTAPPTPGRGRSGKRAKRTESFANLADVQEADEDDPAAHTANGSSVDWLDRNKQNIKKLVAAEMAKRKMTKQDAEYKEVFTATSRGVQFAVRHQANLGEVSRQKILSLTNSHLRMYLATTTTNIS